MINVARFANTKASKVRRLKFPLAHTGGGDLARAQGDMWGWDVGGTGGWPVLQLLHYLLT